ncbi:MAG: PqqD family protein [Bacteroidales bacterium]|nr:PqqD family protein [Bacteroidales bacterium]
MKLKEGFVLRTICGENVISGEGTRNINFSKLISLNETAAFLYRKVQGSEFTPETLADLLTEEYEVSREVALKDAEKLVRQWVDAGIAE